MPYMSIFKNKVLWGVLAVLIIAAGLMFVQWNTTLRVAHSSFENYYAFRGCTKLIDRTDTYGDCQTASGQTIKIVKFQDRWFLDGDLPWGCIGTVCWGI